MNKCFVIQPFDNGKFDKRFEDVFRPAIVAAGFDPYRVDRDPRVSIPIEDIQSEIESSRSCLADITEDNPNVWFELGYAIAMRREVVLLCSEERKSKFPFDVQHRRIITYKNESSSDFEMLRSRITERLIAIRESSDKLDSIVRMPSLAPVQGLEQYEVACLILVAEDSIDMTHGTSGYVIRENLENAGFTRIAAALGIRGLIRKGMLEEFEDADYNNSTFTAYRVTEDGIAWLINNTDGLKLKDAPRQRIEEDDIPF